MANYSTRSSAVRAARRMFGESTQEGHDWIIIQSQDGSRFDYEPGPKYDTAANPCNHPWFATNPDAT